MSSFSSSSAAFSSCLLRQRLARFGQRLGQGQGLADRLQLGIDLADVEFGLLLLQSRLHLRELGQRLAQIDARLLQLFDRLLQLGDELFDLGVLLFAGEFFERLQLVRGAVGRFDDHRQRLGRTGAQLRPAVT